MRHAFIGLIGAAAVLCAPTESENRAGVRPERPQCVAAHRAHPCDHQTLDKGVVTFVIPEGVAPSRR